LQGSNEKGLQPGKISPVPNIKKFSVSRLFKIRDKSYLSLLITSDRIDTYSKKELISARSEIGYLD
jgi:hypothetical protein